MVQLVHSARKVPQDLGPLDRLGWLAAQGPDLKEWFATHGRWRSYGQGEVIYLHDDNADGMYGLASGAIELQFAPIGSEPVTLHRAEPGFWIGESALLANAKRLLSLFAATDCRIFRVPAAPLRQLLAESPHHWPAFYELTHANTGVALILLSEALSLTPRVRLARLLQRLSETQAEIVANQDDLGRLLGLKRSSLRRALNRLTTEGVVTTGYGRIRIADRNRLKAICAEV